MNKGFRVPKWEIIRHSRNLLFNIQNENSILVFCYHEQKWQAMNWQKYIISDQTVLLGKPTIKGTRLSVDHIVQLLAQGWTEEEILENYPRLKKEHLKAIFSYLHECMQDGLLYAETADNLS